MSLYLFIFLLSCVKVSFGYFITVDAHAEECFFEKAQANYKMSLTFEIAEGGFLDIDVKVMAPNGQIIYEGERETIGKYMFQAEEDGIYTYCFSNKMSTMTPKVVLFNMEVFPPTKDENKGQINHNEIDEMIKTLSTTLTGVKHEQEYMRIRDRIHREISESTNFRVVLWSLFEAFVLVVMTLGQIYYLKRFFEVRRVV